MEIVIAFCLAPVALGFLLVGFFVGLAVKKRGKSPWLWGGLTVIVITAMTWQQLPKWAGAICVFEMTVFQSIIKQIRMLAKPPDPNAMVQLTLPARDNVYTFSIPAVYVVEPPAASKTVRGVRLICKYPTMEASPGSLLSEKGALDILIRTDVAKTGRVQYFLDQAASGANLQKHVGKQGEYDVFQLENKANGAIDKSLVFTAVDGQLVLVVPAALGHRLTRKVTSDIEIQYQFFKGTGIGDDFIKIDTIVSDFVKTHLKTQLTPDNSPNKKGAQ